VALSALVVAAQAFLLRIVTNDGVDYGAAVAVAAAGSAASLMAGIALGYSANASGGLASKSRRMRTAFARRVLSVTMRL
jgi:hypothetical protein